MVEALRRVRAARDAAVLQAMGRVPRETFVPHFFSLPDSLKTGTPADVRESHIDGDGGDEPALNLVYDIDRALGIRRNAEPTGATAGAGITSAASAPRLVAAMLELAQVATGMRILEIGTGSGYNAALLRELVGPQGQVTSVDIDSTLVAEASERLNAAGYADIEVTAADGYFGVARRAPFDRVLATVGCADVAPAWLAQLAAGGFCLVPLQHGGLYPLARVEPKADGATATIVAPARFVAIQGHKAGPSHWPHAGRLGPDPKVEWSPLSDWLVRALEQGDGQDPWCRTWDMDYLVALEDRRAASALSLNDGASSAAIDPKGGRVGYLGPDGRELQDRLLELACMWVGLGRPARADYTSLLSPLEPTSAVMATSLSWVIDRLDYRQVVSLEREPI
jgi:protein-L-isoaspartate(D-aspartate) O-methyltransferase